MNSFQAPIADFAVSFYLERPIGILDEYHGQAITKTIELIKSLSQAEGVEKTIEMMKPDLFDLKISLAPVLFKDNTFFQTYLEKIAIEIASKRNTNTLLGKAVSDVLLLFDSLIEPFSDQISPDLLNGITLPDYNSLIAFSSIFQDKSLRKSIALIDFALELDCAMIIADLMLNKKLSLPLEEKRLIKQLNSKAEDLAIICIEEGLLPAEGGDLSQIHRNAKIRAALSQVDQNSGKVISTEELKTLFAS